MEEKRASALGGIIYGVLFAACALVWIFVGFKAALLVFGLFQGFLWVNMVIGSITSSAGGRKPQDDAFWRILLVLLFSISMGVYFSI